MRQQAFMSKFGLVQVKHNLLNKSHDGNLVLQNNERGILVEVTWNMVGYSGVIRVAKVGTGIIHGRNLNDLLEQASVVLSDLLAERD